MKKKYQKCREIINERSGSGSEGVGLHQAAGRGSEPQDQWELDLLLHLVTTASQCCVSPDRTGPRCRSSTVKTERR